MVVRRFCCLIAFVMLLGLGSVGSAWAVSASIKNPVTKAPFGPADITIAADYWKIVRSDGPVVTWSSLVEASLIARFDGGEEALGCDRQVTETCVKGPAGDWQCEAVRSPSKTVEAAFPRVPVISREQLLEKCRSHNGYWQGVENFEIKLRAPLRLNPNCLVGGMSVARIEKTANLPVQLQCLDETAAAVYNVVEYSCPQGFVVEQTNSRTLEEKYQLDQTSTNAQKFGMKQKRCVLR